MSARILTNEEYAELGAKVGAGGAAIKQVHRLLCDGHKVEDLTPTERSFTAVFEGAHCVRIPNDYGWEPAIEVADAEAVRTPAPEPRPKKGK